MTWGIQSVSYQRLIVRGAVTLLIALGIGYYVSSSISKSSAYKVAEEAVIHDPQVVRIVGEVRNTSLKLVGGSNVLETDTSGQGRAEFYLNVQGERNTVKVMVTLERHAGVWKVDRIDILK